MNKTIYFTLILGILALVGTSYAQGALGFSSVNFGADMLDLSNGIVDDDWADVNGQAMSPFGSAGEVKFANNETHLFSLIIADASAAWLSVEFNGDPSSCMASGNDGWTFYIDSGEVTAKDVSFSGTVIPGDDGQNDLSIESIVDGGTIYIEVVRPFVTGDSSGADVQYSNGTLIYLTFASDTVHFDGPSQYYLSVAYYEGEPPAGGGCMNNIALPDTGPDWTKIKVDILKYALLFAGAFIHTHYVIRVVKRPLDHGSRLVEACFEDPKVLDRVDDVVKKYKKGDD